MSNNIPAELKYVSSHEWLRAEADGSVTVGVTHHAQELLGDIVFVELPEVGASLAAEDQAGVVESVKAASDVYAPTKACPMRLKPSTAIPTVRAGSSASSRPTLPTWTA